MFSPVSIAPPDALDIRTNFDWRLRLERRIDRDFSDAADNRSDALNRIRAGVTWTYGKNWSGELQYQLAHDEIWRPGSTASDEASDVRLANVKWKDKKVDVTVGRQKIDIGTERLIGSLDWSMTGRTYDGVRLKTGNWDAYAFKVGVAYPKSGRTRIAGASYRNRAGLSSLIFKHDDQAHPTTDIWTLTHWWQKPAGAWTWDAEAALQSGHTAGKKQTAWAIHLGGTYTLSKKAKAWFEVNAASGGGNANNAYTFDNLLPTNHKFYGSMDLQAWRNMQEIAIGYDRVLDPKWSIRVHGHSFSLRDASDAWYGAGGGANAGPGGAFIDPTGNSGRDVGRELDIEFTYKHDARWNMTGGLAAFWPGGFVKARNGGNVRTQYWGYVAVQFKY